MKNQICHTNRNAFISTVAGCFLAAFNFVKLFVFSILNAFKFKGFSRLGTLFLKRGMVAGLTALVAGALSQPTDAALIQMGDDLGGIGHASGYVVIPIEVTNNDSGTEYIQFDLDATKPLIQGIYDFIGGSSSEFATLGDMFNGYSESGTKKNFDFTLDNTPDYVNGVGGWQTILNPDGSMTIGKSNPISSETWEDTTDPSGINNTAKGTFSVYQGLLDANRNANDYDFNNVDNGDLNLFQSTNTYQTDFGTPAGVALDNSLSPIPADNTYVQTAVIPEPGTIGLVGVGLLTALAASKLGKKNKGRRIDDGVSTRGMLK